MKGAHKLSTSTSAGSWNGRIPTVCRPWFRIFPRNITHRLSDHTSGTPNPQLPMLQAFPISSASLFANYVLRAEEAEIIETRLRLQEKEIKTQADEALVRAVESLQEVNADLRKQLEIAIQSNTALELQLQQRPTTYHTQTCVNSHPSVVCWTETLISNDDSKDDNCVELTFHTTAQRMPSGPSNSNSNSNSSTLNLSKLDLAALAAISLSEAVANLTADLETKAAGAALLPKEQEATRHKEIVDMLTHGNVVTARSSDHVSAFGHESFIVTLEDPNNAHVHLKAFFKPDVQMDEWNRVTCEVVAYHLNLLLGMDLVPPAVHRKGVELIVDGQKRYYPDGGSFIYWCEDAIQLSDVPESSWKMSKNMLLSDCRILDVLLHNSDRHLGHYLYGQHWAKGHYNTSNNNSSEKRWEGEMRPILIDHSASFRHDAYVCLDHDNAFGTGPIRHISAKTYLSLRYLAGSVLHVAGVMNNLAASELREMLTRQENVVKFFDQLVQLNERCIV